MIKYPVTEDTKETAPAEQFVPANTSSILVNVKPIGQVTKERDAELKRKYPHYVSYYVPQKMA